MTAETKNSNKTNEASNPMNAVTECFRATFDATHRFQQDVWSMMFGQNGTGKGVDEIQSRTKTMADQTVKTVQTQMDTSRRLFDQTSRAGLDLLDKCVSATREGTEQRDALAAARNIWQDSFDTFRSNSEAVAKANADMVDNVSRYVSESLKLAEPVRSGK